MPRADLTLMHEVHAEICVRLGFLQRGRGCCRGGNALPSGGSSLRCRERRSTAWCGVRTRGGAPRHPRVPNLATGAERPIGTSGAVPRGCPGRGRAAVSCFLYRSCGFVSSLKSPRRRSLSHAARMCAHTSGCFWNVQFWAALPSNRRTSLLCHQLSAGSWQVVEQMTGVSDRHGERRARAQACKEASRWAPVQPSTKLVIRALCLQRAGSSSHVCSGTVQKCSGGG